jgi:hypothetical protein
LDPEEYGLKAVTLKLPEVGVRMVPTTSPVLVTWSAAGIDGEENRMTGCSLKVEASIRTDVKGTFCVNAKETSVKANASALTE